MPDLMIWENAKNIIRDKISPQSFERWLVPIKLSGLTGDDAALEVPNKFFEDWVVEKYLKFIEEALTISAGRKISVSFTQPAQAPESTPFVLPEKPRLSAQPQKSVGLNTKYSFADFVVGPSNRFAHAACMAVAEAPARAYNPLFIYGGVGLGKTHLMHAIGNKAFSQNKDLKVLYLPGEHFTNQLINAIQNRTTIKFRQLYRSVDILLIDDIQFIGGKEATQEEFFNTFNTLHDTHKQIIISSDRSPKDIPALEERLISRFEWGLVTDIQPPDLETRVAILRKKVEKDAIAFPNDVAFFIAEKIKSNIRELEGALIRVLAYAKLIGGDITVPLVKEVLKDMVLGDEVRVSVDLIQKKVAEHFNIRVSDLKGKKRNRAIVYPRQIAMYLARDLTDYSLPELGNFFGGRDHTTVLHACEKIGRGLAKTQSGKELISRLIIGIKA